MDRKRFGQNTTGRTWAPSGRRPVGKKDATGAFSGGRPSDKSDANDGKRPPQKGR